MNRAVIVANEGFSEFPTLEAALGFGHAGLIADHEDRQTRRAQDLHGVGKARH